jgi:ADP-ribose pyrophosphatase
VGVVLIGEGKILLEKRKNEPGRGKWSIPGGIVELGESLERTVVRETLEETGLSVSEPEPIDVINQVTLDENGKVKYHFVIIDYFVKLGSGELKAASDAEELEWVAFEDVEKRDLTKSFQDFFQKNRNRLEKMNSF